MNPLLHPRSWGYHAVAVVAVVAASLLGLWQYHGWQDRREAAARDLTDVAPVPLAAVIGPDDPFPGQYVGQPVEVTGTWVPNTVLTVTDRRHDGRPGDWQVGVVRVGHSLLPVVLGWGGGSFFAYQPPTGPAHLVGWLQPSEGAGTPDADPTDDVLPRLRIADLAQRFDQDLYGAYVVMRDPVDGLEQADLDQLPEAGRFTAIRNLLYALEWWFFGGFAVFVWWRWARETVEGESSTPR